MNKTLADGFEHFGAELTSGMETKLLLFAQMLLEANKVMNLTAITETDEIYLKHFVDSVSCQGLIPHGASVIDVGTGAGFPGIPLKIARDDLKVTLLDSLKKRVDFLQRTTAALNLDGIRAVHMRAEDGGRIPELRESFDTAVSRAVASMTVLCEYCLPFVKVGGVFLAQKGREAQNETNEAEKAISELGGRAEKIIEVFWQGLEHRVVVIRKVCKTPAQYPRKAGKPAKAPII